jgi:hypothetical protein
MHNNYINPELINHMKTLLHERCNCSPAQCQHIEDKQIFFSLLQQAFDDGRKSLEDINEQFKQAQKFLF